MTLPDLSYAIEARDDFSSTFNDLERQIRESDRRIESLQRSLDHASLSAVRAARETSHAARNLNIGPDLRGQLVGLASGALGGFAAAEIVQRGVQYLEYSTQVQRTSEAFELLSGSSEAAAAKLAAVQSASGGAIDRLAAMQIANKAAALGFASTGQELERVTRFATITGRVLGVDTVTALDNLAAAAANLSFVRLDQMGVSATAVRSRFDELKDTMGESEAFLQATLEVGESTFSGLADSSLTAASGVEILTTAAKDLFATFTGPGSQIDDFAKALGVSLGAGATQDVIGQLENIIEKRSQGVGKALADFQGFLPGSTGNAAESSAAIQQTIDLLGQLDNAVIAGVPGAQGYREELGGIAQAFVQGVATSDQVQRLGVISEWFNLVIGDADNLAAAIDGAGAALSRFPAAPGNRPALGLSPFQFDYRSQEDPLTKFQRESQERRSEDVERRRQEQERAAQAVADAQFRLALTTADTAGQLVLYESQLAQLEAGTVDYINTQTQIARLQNQLADKTESAGGRFVTTLSNLENAFQSAIRGISGIPGFSGRSEVTDFDLRLSQAGLYREKPDEFLRRAEDLLLNGTQRADVDRAFIERAVAASTGFDVERLGTLANDLLFQLLEEEFTSARLFGTGFGQENLDRLLNQQAIAFGLQQQGQANMGQQFLMNQFNNSPLAGIFANAGGFAGQFEQELNSVGFSSQVGSIIGKQFQSEDALSRIDNAMPAVYRRIEEAVVSNAEAGAVGWRLLNIWLSQMMNAELETGY